MTMRPKLYLYEHNWRSLEEISHATGIKKETLRKRLGLGKTLDQAIAMGVDNPYIRKYPYNGRMMTIREIADETGVSYKRLRSRIDRGWTLEDAICAPMYGQKNPSEQSKAGADAILNETPADEEARCRAAINICRKIMVGDPREVCFRCVQPMIEYMFESDILGYRIRFENGGTRARLTAWYKKHGFESSLHRTYAIEGDKARELLRQQQFTGGMS